MTAALDEHVSPAPPARTPRAGGAGGRTALLLLLLVGVGLPLIAVLIRAVTGYNGQPSALGELGRPENIRILTNTVVLGILVVVFSTIMAAPLAFLMSWTRMREHRWIDIVLLIPFMTPPYVASLAWLDFTRRNGLAEQILGPVGSLVGAAVQTPFGMAAIMACEVFPFLYLILRNHLDAMPASSDEMASIAGASPWQRFRRIIMPLSTANFSLGVLIVFIRAIGEFGTPVTIGNQIGFPVLVSEIYGDVTIDPLDFPSAAAFSSVLLGLGIVVWGLQQWFGRSTGGYGGRASRRTTIRLRTGGRITGWVWLGLVLLVSVVIPYIAVVLGAMTILRSKPLTLDNLTFDYFALVLQPTAGLPALTNSMLYAFLAATIATAVGIACALATARPTRLGRVVDMLAVAPDTVPAIVLAIGFIFFWNSPLLPVTPYNTGAMLVIAYVVIFLPMVIQNVKTARNGIDDRLLEAAYAAGASGPQRFFRILLPLLVPGIVSGWMLAFLIGLREVVVSSMVRPASMKLLSPWIMGQFDQGHRAEAMAMTVIGVVSSTVILVILEVWRQRQAARRL